MFLVAPDGRPDKTGPTIHIYAVDSSTRSTQNLFKKSIKESQERIFEAAKNPTPETQYGRRLRNRLAMRLARSPRFETLPGLWISQTTSTGFPVLWVQDPLLHQVTDCLQTGYCDVLSAKLQDLSTRTCQCQCTDARPRSKRSRMP